MSQRIAVNRCYGGFGLSHEAQRALIGQCEHIRLIEPSEYYGGLEGWERRFAEDQKLREGVGAVLVHEGKIVLDEHRQDETRTCPAMIAVVERLGEAANSWAARIEIVDVPDGVDWQIDEYDGQEWVSEAHSTW